MHPKLNNPFAHRLTHAEESALRKYIDDDAIKQITILPSFKLKTNRLRNGKKIIRCDDVVIQTKRAAPKYNEYQVGCGFLFLKLECAATSEELQQALPSIVESILKLSAPQTSKSQERDSSHNRHTAPPTGNEFSLICTGHNHFLSQLRKKNDSFSFVGNPQESPAIEEDLARTLVSEEWIQSLNGHFSSHNFLKLTGSHYFDFLRPESEDETHHYINIHACGLQFSDLTNKQTNQRINEDRLSESDFLCLTQVMKNYATLKRVYIVSEILNQLSIKFGDVTAEIVSDQTHHDSKLLPDGSHLFYNDSQPLSKAKPSILPSGFANIPSYIALTGSQTDVVLGGLPHNLKPAIRKDQNRKCIPLKVSIVEAIIPSSIKRLFGSSVSTATQTAILQTSPATNQLLNQFLDRNILTRVETLIPLFRFRVRRPREKPFARCYPS